MKKKMKIPKKQRNNFILINYLDNPKFIEEVKLFEQNIVIKDARGKKI